jgi:hypothetical protein
VILLVGLTLNSLQQQVEGIEVLDRSHVENSGLNGQKEGPLLSIDTGSRQGNTVVLGAAHQPFLFPSSSSEQSSSQHRQISESTTARMEHPSLMPLSHPHSHSQHTSSQLSTSITPLTVTDPPTASPTASPTEGPTYQRRIGGGDDSKKIGQADKAAATAVVFLMFGFGGLFFFIRYWISTIWSDGPRPIAVYLNDNGSGMDGVTARDKERDSDQLLNKEIKSKPTMLSASSSIFASMTTSMTNFSGWIISSAQSCLVHMINGNNNDITTTTTTMVGSGSGKQRKAQKYKVVATTSMSSNGGTSLNESDKEINKGGEQHPGSPQQPGIGSNDSSAHGEPVVPIVADEETGGRGRGSRGTLN